MGTFVVTLLGGIVSSLFVVRTVCGTFGGLPLFFGTITDVVFGGLPLFLGVVTVCLLLGGLPLRLTTNTGRAILGGRPLFLNIGVVVTGSFGVDENRFNLLT